MHTNETKSNFVRVKKPVVAMFAAAMLLSSTATIALAAQRGAPAAAPSAPAAPLPDFNLVTTGDSLISIRTTAELDNPDFQKVVKAIKEGDAGFTNFEEVMPKPGTSPGALSGDTYMSTSPAHLQDLVDMGLNLFGQANNHVYDYGQQGLLDTIAETEKLKAVAAFAGVGRTLGEARQPGYFSSRHGLVALIDAASSFNEDATAGDPRPDMPGRAGLNPIRYITYYNVDQATFDVLKSIQNKPGVAGRYDQGTGAVGWWGSREAAPRSADILNVGGRTYHLSAKPGVVRKLMQHDMEAIARNIKDAKERSTYVLASIHNHENGVEPFPNADPALGVPTTTADFLIDFAHASIDAGADEYSGTGPHTLRGIEIYKGKPILYSLGDLFMQNDLVRVMPTEFYNRYQLGPDATPSEGFAARGGYDNIELSESVVAKTLFKNGKPVEVKLTPILMRLKVPGNEGRFGVPMFADATTAARILGRLQEMSKPFGTTITIRGGVGYIAIPQSGPAVAQAASTSNVSTP